MFHARQVHVQVTTRLCRRRNFFPTSRVTQERKKNQGPTSYLLQDSLLSFFVLRVAQLKKAKDFFANKLHTRAVEAQEAKEAIESARAGLSPQKGNVRKKRKEKRKTKEGGLLPQEGDVRKRRKEKKKTMEGKKVATAKAMFRVPYTKNFFFGSRVFGLGCGPSRLKYRLLRDLVHEEAVCKGSSGNGLPYAAKAVP
jgi:hypothetical protein